MRRLLLLLAFLVALALAAGGASVAPQDAAAEPRPSTLLRTGSKGPRVCALQHLLTGRKPSVYRGIRTYRKRVLAGKRCQFGAHTRWAVYRAKQLLGYPMRSLRPIVAGRDLRLILMGRKARPIAWVKRRGRAHDYRIKTGRAMPTLASTLAGRYVRVLQREVGVVEVPYGSNRGRRVETYQRVTGTRGLAWCAALLQWGRRQLNLPIVGFPAPAHVYTVQRWGRSRGLVSRVPAVARWVVFNVGQGHIGVVERVLRSGRRVIGFVSIEGNASNRVLRRVHYLGRQHTFVDHLRAR